MVQQEATAELKNKHQLVSLKGNGAVTVEEVESVVSAMERDGCIV